MVYWYEGIMITLMSNLQSMVIGVIIIIVTYILFREMKRFFVWLRAKKKLPLQIIDAIEPLVRHLINFAGILLFLLDISSIFGLSEAALTVVPSVVTAVIIVVATWISLQIAKYAFTLVRERRKIPLEVVNAVEMVIKYSIIIVGSAFSILNVVAGLGYSGIIASFILGWFGIHLGRIILIIASIIFTRIISKFIITFFEDLKRRTTLQPKVVDLASILVRYLIYSIVGLIIFSSLLTLIGAPELTSMITSIFTVLVGVGLSFAAAGAIGNFISGLILMSWRPYTTGDRVEIGGGAYGDVADFDIIFTKIITPTKEMIYVPNALVLGNKVINYSPKCIVHPKVTVGYNVDRRVVEELLIKATSMTDGLLNEPRPSVYVRGLAKNYVEYELRAYTSQPNRLVEVYSDVQKNILDLFNEAGIELMVPEYSLDATYFMMGTGRKKPEE